MQIYADVCNRPIKISRSAQTCALGSTVMASVAAGAHGSVLEAVHAMTGCKETVYMPSADGVAVYGRLFRLYSELHDAFGKTERHSNLHGLMKELLDIRDAARA